MVLATIKHKVKTMNLLGAGTSRVRLLRGCGIIGLVGCGVSVITNIVGIILMDGHNPISDTISALAAGEHGWIQDLGLHVFAVGLLACAVGLYTWRLGGLRWNIGVALLVVLALDIFLLAGYNEYGDGDIEGVEIHIYLVYVLGIGFALTAWLLAYGLQRLNRNWGRFSGGIAVAWTVLSPPFLMLNTGIDGAYERFLAAMLLAWVAFIAWLLLQEGRGELPETP